MRGEGFVREGDGLVGGCVGVFTRKIFDEGPELAGVCGVGAGLD